MRRAAALALLPLLLAGCTQVKALAPVGGDRQTEVRYAAIDVLTREKVDILTAPVCTTVDSTGVTCAGETLTHEQIRAESPADAQELLTVTVGGRTLYTGTVQSVLDQAMSTP